MEIGELGVNNAFLNGELQEEVYMQQPCDYNHGDNSEIVGKLNKAIYGLKQAPWVWFEKLKSALIKLNYHLIKSYNSLFIKIQNDSVIYILIYVDDFIITHNYEDDINQLIQQLDQQFSIKDLGNLNYFLGIEFKRPSDSEIHLSQRKYISKILNKSKMNQAKPLPIPMVSSLNLSRHQGETIENEKQYRSVVGTLQYVTITRPDIAYSIKKVC